MIFATPVAVGGGPRDMLIRSNNKMTPALVCEYITGVSELNGDVALMPALYLRASGLLFSRVEMLVRVFYCDFPMTAA